MANTNSRLKYKNPVIFADYSDPDVIRVGEYFYLVSSSFNFVPGIPVLRSINLVEWEHVNYVLKELPFERFNGRVLPGDGVWAPSIRCHGGKFYCVIPFPDDGIYVCETEDMEGEWSKPRCLIKGKGIIDPCPIWEGDKCYLAVAFAKSRAGFNSCIGVYEVSPKLDRCISPTYKIVYDGHNDNPVIEGPKFYKVGEYFYILAPAGSVKSGWQTALRSRNIYGPYESKVILMQGDSLVNGPHQGALVDTKDGDFWFMHFQDRRVYGRIVHLQPVTWQNGWPVCGRVKYDGLAGTPVEGGDYPVKIKSGAKLPTRDSFNKPCLSPMWQFPCNYQKEWFSAEKTGLRLFCLNFEEDAKLLPNALTTKIRYRQFYAECSLELCASRIGDEAAFGITGKESAFVSVAYTARGYELRFTVSDENGEQILLHRPLSGGNVTLGIEAYNEDIYRLMCSFSSGGKNLPYDFEASCGTWVGARFALFARNQIYHDGGYAVVNSFKITEIKE